MQIIVQAVNGNLQGVASDPIQFTIPPLAKAKAPEVAMEPTSHREVAPVNGSNGHANGGRQPALS